MLSLNRPEFPGERQKGRAHGVGWTGYFKRPTSDDAESSSSRLQDAYLPAMQLPHRGVFYPLGYSIEIITNNTFVLEAAGESFGRGPPRRIHRVFEPEIGFNLRSC